MIKTLFTIICLLLLSACSTAPFRQAVPEHHQDNAYIEGIEAEIRFWGDEQPSNLDHIVAIKKAQMKAHGTQIQDMHYLALSGGGRRWCIRCRLVSRME